MAKGVIRWVDCIVVRLMYFAQAYLEFFASKQLVDKIVQLVEKYPRYVLNS